MSSEESSMLVLSRRSGERIFIGEDIVLTVIEVFPSKVRIGIDAPRNVVIHREEVKVKLSGGQQDGRKDPA